MVRIIQKKAMLTYLDNNKKTVIKKPLLGAFLLYICDESWQI